MSDLLTVTDQMGREVTFSFPPSRIISLVPSQTEFLIDIGAPVVGRTKFCIHPKNKVDDIPIIGGTKKFAIDKIKALQPDLIIGNKEENEKEGIEALTKAYPVWMSDIFTLDDAFQMMVALGHYLNVERTTNKIVESCKEALSKVKNSKEDRVIYLIWRKPWMTAGKNTFIDHILNYLGYKNLITKDRYPEIALEDLKALKPDKILLSSEPFPFKEKHAEEIQNIIPDVKCELVDGELYSWYGSRLRAWSDNIEKKL